MELNFCPLALKVNTIKLMNSLFRIGTLIIAAVLAINYYFNRENPLALNTTSSAVRPAISSKALPINKSIKNQLIQKIPVPSNEANDINLLIANYSKEFTLTENEDSDVDWNFLHTEWLNRLKDHLEEKYELPKIAHSKIRNYIQIKRKYLNDPELKKLYQKNDKTLSVVASNQDNNVIDSEAKGALLDFVGVQQEITEYRKEEEQVLQDYWGNDYKEVQSLLTNYNKEISTANAHLGYDIGIGL